MLFLQQFGLKVKKKWQKLVLKSALKKKNCSNSDIFFHSNFKRLIGNPFEKKRIKKILSPKECGEKFFQILWENIPQKLEY